MKNANAVRKLLVGNLLPEQVGKDEKEILANVFDRLIEAQSSGIVPKLVCELIDPMETSDLSGVILTRKLLSGKSIENILQALIYAFPEQAGNMAAITNLAMKKLNEGKDYKDDLGQHAVVMSFLFELADFRDFEFSRETFDHHLIEFLKEGFLHRYFRRSIIYHGQSSELSKQIAKFVTNAEVSLRHDKSSNRWDLLRDLLSITKQAFPGNTPVGDASLEYALINDLCFKMFGTLSPIDKLALVEGHFKM